MLKGHAQIDHVMRDNQLDYIMLMSTTKSFVDNNIWFIEKLCFGCTHPPVINIANGDTCENGIVFDVEYKAQMSNGQLVEIATLQIDEGNTDFAYGIKYNGIPVVTVHAVFFASSVERTIYTYLDRATRHDNKETLPMWLAPIQCRLLPEPTVDGAMVAALLQKFASVYRVEIDDREIPCSCKVKDAIQMKIPYIISVGNELSVYNRNTESFMPLETDRLLSVVPDETFVLGQFSPIKLSQRILQ
jgi:hypothetical protein